MAHDSSCATPPTTPRAELTATLRAAGTMATKTNNLWVAYGDPKMWVGNLDERPCSNLKFNLGVWADGIGVCTVRDLRQQHTTQVQLTPQAPDPVSKQKYEVWADTDAIISLDHPYYKEHKYEFDKKLNVITNEQYLEALGLIDFAFTTPAVRSQKDKPPRPPARDRATPATTRSGKRNINLLGPSASWDEDEGGSPGLYAHC